MAMAGIATEGRKDGEKPDHEGPCGTPGEHLGNIFGNVKANDNHQSTYY